MRSPWWLVVLWLIGAAALVFVELSNGFSERSIVTGGLIAVTGLLVVSAMRGPRREQSPRRVLLALVVYIVVAAVVVVVWISGFATPPATR